MQTDLHVVDAEVLDGMPELDATFVDFNTLCRERVGDLVGRHGAEELSVFADPLVDDNLHSLHALGGFARNILLLLGQQRPLLALLLDGFQIARGGLTGQIFRDQKVARVAVLHIDHIAARAKAAKFLNQDDFHQSDPFA